MFVDVFPFYSHRVMHTGKLILFFEHNELVRAVCLKETERKLHVLREDGKEGSLPPSRALHAGSYTFPLDISRKALLDMLHKKAVHLRKLQKEVALEDLWKKVIGRNKTMRGVQLAECMFGTAAESDHEAAVITAIMQDRIFFKLQGTQFVVHSQEQVDRLKAKARLERKRRREIKECTDWLKAAVRNKKAPRTNNSLCIELLKDFAVFGTDAPRAQDCKEVLTAVDLFDRNACFELLVKLSIWQADQNLLIERHGIAHQWPPDVSEQAAAFSAVEDLPCSRDREDLTHLTCYSIDEPFTRDIDDAVSFTPHADGAELGVHITDASAYIAPGCPIDREAARRGASLYTPDGKIPMIPQDLSEDIASLRARETKPAISFLISLSPEGEATGFRGTASTVRVSRKLTYQTVDTEIARGGKFKNLYSLALNLRDRRLAAGASSTLVPELLVRVNRNKRITYTIRDRETPSQLLVAECMILANHCAALLLKEKEYPALYRKQSKPSQKINHEEEPTLLQTLTRRKHFSRIDINTRPGLHSGLGLTCYTTITSPLRKYLDLVTQRQLAALLRGAPPLYSAGDLKKISMDLQPVLTKVALVEQERKRYWVLKLLKKRRGKKIEALVLEKKSRYWRIVLTDYLFEVNMKASSSADINPGDLAVVIIEHVDLFNRTLRVRLA